MTEVDSNVKSLIKILIGAAWIDGTIQPEERQYLHHMIQVKGMADDPEIKPLLTEIRPIKPEECYEWVRQYLGDRPDSEKCQQLIEAISGLIYSDGTVANEEAKLLTDIQFLDATNEDTKLGTGAVLNSIRNLYQRWVNTLNK